MKKLVKELERIRGRHTELVSVYIPSGANLVETVNMLREEYSLAQNVKDKSVRKNVMSALEKILQYLKLFRSTPENGLIVFCGNVSPEPGKVDMKLWSIMPPEKLTAKVYRCDQVFIIDALKEFTRERDVYGLIVLDAREANVGLLKGKAIESLKHLDSTVPSKTVKGGMSQARYDRLREDAMNDFFRKVGEVISQALLQLELKGVIIGGPGPTKDKFAKGNYLHHEIKKKVIGIKDIGYTGEYGLQELVKRAEDLMENASIVKERELMEKFFSELQKGGKVVYGFKQVNKALETGAVDILLISEGFDWVHAKLKCSKCDSVVERDLAKDKIETQYCDECKKQLEVEETKELMDEMVERAKSVGTRVEFISVETREGSQFKELGGIGAFLRYKLS
ncbi:MAG: peptide chain release factor aRF-1 [Candidatus Bathyarchaeota archaeon]|nr:peptide chain release factor aRF-1 [Candidatus Bathyarchaeota archaeon]